MGITISKSWDKYLNDELQKDYFKELLQKTALNYADGKAIFPKENDLFTAFVLCPTLKLKVVILGQDPYHNEGQAHGLSFSVPHGVRIPPSLRNIYKERNTDVHVPIPNSGNLEHWATQGVLLLNSILTVESGKPGSHHGLGWEKFTDGVVRKISDEKEHVVFLLWGKYAQSKTSLIDTKKHLVLTAPHPSPFSAHSGFFGSKHFSKTNAYLLKNGQQPITW